MELFEVTRSVSSASSLSPSVGLSDSFSITSCLRGRVRIASGDCDAVEEARILSALKEYLESRLQTIKDEASDDEPWQALATVTPMPLPSTRPIGNAAAASPDIGAYLAIPLPPGLELGSSRPVGLSPDSGSIPLQIEPCSLSQHMRAFRFEMSRFNTRGFNCRGAGSIDPIFIHSDGVT